MNHECIVVAHWGGKVDKIEMNLPVTLSLGIDMEAGYLLQRLVAYIEEQILEDYPSFETDKEPIIDNIIWLPKEEKDDDD